MLVSAFIEAMSVIMTCAMVYLVPVSYSILVICTYPIMHSLSSYLMVNQGIRRYEIVAIVASILGFFSLVQLDIAEIKRLFNDRQSLYQTAIDL